MEEVIEELLEVVVLEVVIDDVVLMEVVVVVVALVVLVTVEKFAVIVPGPLITTDVEVDSAFEVDIEPLTLHDTKAYPLAGETAICRVEPAYQEVPCGDVVPPLTGALDNPTRY